MKSTVSAEYTVDVVLGTAETKLIEKMLPKWNAAQSGINLTFAGMVTAHISFYVSSNDYLPLSVHFTFPPTTTKRAKINSPEEAQKIINMTVEACLNKLRALVKK